MKKFILTSISMGVLLSANAQKDENGAVTPIETNEPTEITLTHVSIDADIDSLERAKIEETEAAYNEHPKFKSTDVPAKWQNESAVILYQSFDYVYTVVDAIPTSLTLSNGVADNWRYVQGYKVAEKEIIRRRIKLQDKMALESFSTFYFSTSEDSYAKFTVIKPDGREIEVGLSEFEENTATVPDFYALTGQSEYHKTAIPELEIGDIIDFTYETTLDVFIPGHIGNMPSHLYVLAEEYPIVAQEYTINMSDGLRIIAKEMNNAPKFLKWSEAIEQDEGDFKYFNSHGATTYRLFDTDRAALKDQYFNYQIRANDYIKFVVKKHTSNSTILDAYKMDYGIPPFERSSIETSLMRKLCTSLLVYTSTGQRPDAAEDAAVLLSRDVRFKNLPNDEKTKAGWDLFQQLYFQQADKKKKKYEETPTQIATIDFFRGMGYIFEQNDIPFKIIVTSPRSLGHIEDAIMLDEVSVYFYVPGKNPLVFNQFTRNNNFQNKLVNVVGASAYVYSPPNRKFYVRDDFNYDAGSLKLEYFSPNTNPIENERATYLAVNLDDSRDTLLVSATNSYLGQERHFMRNNLLHYDSYHLDVKKGNKKKQEARARGVRKYLDYRQRRRDGYRKAYLNRDYPTTAYENFNIVESGSTIKGMAFSFSEDYKVSGLLHPAGDDYILDAGKLIGGQIALDSEDYDRTTDAYLDHSKVLKNTIEITIPDGYTIGDIAHLNSMVDNEYGAFVSTAKIEGNTLKITTTKRYKMNHVPMAFWPDMVEFLDTAWEFSQQKVVLVKN